MDLRQKAREMEGRKHGNTHLDQALANTLGMGLGFRV